MRQFLRSFLIFGVLAVIVVVVFYAGRFLKPQESLAQVGAAVTAVNPSVTLYVATNGNDQNAGTSLSAPLLTVGRAAALARTTYKNMPIAVRIRAGVYSFSTPALIDAFVGPIDIRPYNGEAVTLSGATFVTLSETGTVNGLRLFSGTLPSNIATTTLEKIARQSIIRVNGGGARKARFPNSGYLAAQAGNPNPPQLVYDQTAQYCPGTAENPFAQYRGEPAKAGSIALPTTLPASYDLSNAYIHIYLHDSWGNVLAPVRRDGSNLVAAGGEVFGHPCLGPEQGSRYFLENIPQALDSAEEFYIDVPTRTIQWLAPANLPATQTTVKASIPVNGTLIKITGGDTRVIEGMTVGDTLSPLAPPATAPLREKRANTPAIAVNSATNVTVQNMSFAYVGTSVGVGSPSSNISLTGNTVRITYGPGMYAFGTDNALIADNSVLYAGQVDKDGRGIQGGITNSLITGNYVERTAAGGISCAACAGTSVSYNAVRARGKRRV